MLHCNILVNGQLGRPVLIFGTDNSVMRVVGIGDPWLLFEEEFLVPTNGEDVLSVEALAMDELDDLGFFFGCFLVGVFVLALPTYHRWWALVPPFHFHFLRFSSPLV